MFSCCSFVMALVGRYLYKCDFCRPSLSLSSPEFCSSPPLGPHSETLLVKVKFCVQYRGKQKSLRLPARLCRCCCIWTQWKLLDPHLQPGWMFFHKQVLWVFVPQTKQLGSCLIREMLVFLWKWSTLEAVMENLNCHFRGKCPEGLAQVNRSTFKS